jgi:hypothetical protein
MLVRLMASTVGPSVPTLTSSNTAKKSVGASSIAHRDRNATPAAPPTSRLVSMAINACGVLIGPRGIVSPRITPRMPATATVMLIPIQPRDHTHPKARSGRPLRGGGTDIAGP